MGALAGQACTKTSLQKAVCGVAETKCSGMTSKPARPRLSLGRAQNPCGGFTQACEDLKPLRWPPVSASPNLESVATRLQRSNLSPWISRCCNFSHQVNRQRRQRGDRDVRHCERHKYNRFVKVWLIKASGQGDTAALMQPFNLVTLGQLFQIGVLHRSLHRRL